MSTTLVSLRLYEDFHTYVKKLSLSYVLFCLPVCLASFCGAKWLSICTKVRMYAN